MTWAECLSSVAAEPWHGDEGARCQPATKGAEAAKTGLGPLTITTTRAALPIFPTYLPGGELQRAGALRRLPAIWVGRQNLTPNGSVCWPDRRSP